MHVHVQVQSPGEVLGIAALTTHQAPHRHAATDRSTVPRRCLARRSRPSSVGCTDLLHVWPPLASRFHSSVVSIDTLSCEYGFTESYRRRSVYLCEIAILKAAPGTILATGGGATGTRLRCVYRLPTTSTRLQTLLSFRVQGEGRWLRKEVKKKVRAFSVPS